MNGRSWPFPFLKTFPFLFGLCLFCVVGQVRLILIFGLFKIFMFLFPVVPDGSLVHSVLFVPYCVEYRLVYVFSLIFLISFFPHVDIVIGFSSYIRRLLFLELLLIFIIFALILFFIYILVIFSISRTSRIFLFNIVLFMGHALRLYPYFLAAFGYFVLAELPQYAKKVVYLAEVSLKNALAFDARKIDGKLFGEEIDELLHFFRRS